MNDPAQGNPKIKPNKSFQPLLTLIFHPLVSPSHSINLASKSLPGTNSNSMTSFGLSTIGPLGLLSDVAPRVTVDVGSDSTCDNFERRKSVWLWKAESKLNAVTLARVVGHTGDFPSSGSTGELRAFPVSVDGVMPAPAAGSEEVEGNISKSSLLPRTTELFGFHPTQMPAHIMHTSS